MQTSQAPSATQASASSRAWSCPRLPALRPTSTPAGPSPARARRGLKGCSTSRPASESTPLPGTSGVARATPGGQRRGRVAAIGGMGAHQRAGNLGGLVGMAAGQLLECGAWPGERRRAQGRQPSTAGRKAISARGGATEPCRRSTGSPRTRWAGKSGAGIRALTPPLLRRRRLTR